MSPKGPFADRSYELTVVPEAGITFSRADASALAQAKAANTDGQLALLRHLGVDPGDVDGSTRRRIRDLRRRAERRRDRLRTRPPAGRRPGRRLRGARESFGLGARAP
jgi:hypothetical protein